MPKPPRLLADYRLVGRNQVANTPSSSEAGPGPTYRPGHNRRKCDQPINRFLAFPDRLPRGAGAVEREVLDRPTVISSHSSLSEPVGLRADPRGADGASRTKGLSPTRSANLGPRPAQPTLEASTDPALATTCRVRCRPPSCWHPVHSARGRRGHFGAGRDRGRSEIPRLQAGELCLVQLCGGVRPRLGAMGMEHLVSARHMVGARMMVHWRHCRGRCRG